MAKGGYRIFDMKNIDILSTESANVVSGIYNFIESTNGKPIMLQHVKISGFEQPASIWVNFRSLSGANYGGILSLGSDGIHILKVIVSPSDLVRTYYLDTEIPSASM